MASHHHKPTAMPPPPIIIITDYSSSPPISLGYSCGRNNIIFPTVYKQIKTLLTHPACPHRPSFTWPCHTCESTFTSKYWTCAAALLDYFADFYPVDRPLMQAIWFYLLDIWQGCALNLPYEHVLDHVKEAVSGADPIWGAEQAKAFEKEVRDTITLVEVTIWGRRKETDTWDQVVYDPRGEAWCPVGEYETGPWISGVKPWSQFLGSGGVGVVPPFCAAAAAAKDKGDADVDTGQTPQTTRYIPLPAIGLIEAHTARARTLATQLFTEQDADLVTTSLANFDAHCVALPSSRHESHSYTSRVTGLETTYTLSNGAPPVMRYAGLGDPQMELTRPPDWNLVDECVASCRGVTAYQPVSDQGEDEGEDEVMEDSEEDEGVFDLWTVVERQVGHGARGEQGQVLDLGDMFESWCGVDEF